MSHHRLEVDSTFVATPTLSPTLCHRDVAELFPFTHIYTCLLKISNLLFFKNSVGIFISVLYEGCTMFIILIYLFILKTFCLSVRLIFRNFNAREIFCVYITVSLPLGHACAQETKLVLLDVENEHFIRTNSIVIKNILPVSLHLRSQAERTLLNGFLYIDRYYNIFSSGSFILH